MSLLDDIKRDYPELWWLFNDPEVGPILREGADPNRGLAPEEFKQKIFGTSWYRTRSQSMRNWEVLYHTNPGEANRRRAEYKAQLSQVAKRLGVSLSAKELSWLTEVGLQRGQDPTGAEVMHSLVQMSRTHGTYGAIRSARVDAQNLASGKYFRRLSATSANQWGRMIAVGDKTLEDLETQMQLEAANRMPWMAEALKSGQSVAEIIDPLRRIVAQELELGNPNNVNVMSDPQWRKLLGIQDPTSSKMRMMTESEAMAMARSDKRYWQTQGGRKNDADMTSKLLNVFGVRKSA